MDNDENKMDDEAKKAKKAKDPNEEAENDMEKSKISVDDLEKSMAMARKLIDSTPSGRKRELLAKGGRDGLSPDEEIELSLLIKSKDTAGEGQKAAEDLKGEPLAKSQLKEQNGEALVKSLDELQEMLHGAVDKLGKAHDTSASQNAEYGVTMLKSQNAISQALVGLVRHTERLEAQLTEQADLIKSWGAVPVTKEIPGTRAPATQVPGAGGGSLNKGHALQVLDAMLKANVSAGNKGKAACGESFVNVISSVESNGAAALSNNMRQEMNSFLAHQRS